MTSIFQYTAFVPNGDSRTDTLRFLLDAAESNGLDARSVRGSKARDGFNITEELADVLYDESAEDETPTDEAPAKTAKKKKE